MRTGLALALSISMILAGLSGCFGSPDSEDDSEILSPEIYSVTGSIDGNVSEVWFSVNSTADQALKIESLYISFCAPTDDDGDDPNTTEVEEYPYACDISRTSLEVNSTCNGASINLVVSETKWLPSGDCTHLFGELGPFDEGYKHLAPYRNATWNMMYSIQPVIQS